MEHETRHGSAGLRPGDVVDFRFEIETELGRGAAGAVYRAYDRDLDEVVALKRLQVPSADPVWTADRFRSEVKLARRVAHVNVCRIFDYGEHAGRPYFSMELIPGCTVKERLADGAYAPQAAVDVAAQVADALEAIHRAGIVHRDMKPQNLIEDEGGIVKVTDFGIATVARVAGETDPCRYVLGTPEYMSPEQVQGQPIDSRSDLYSLGVVLYEMLTGRVPLEGADPLRDTAGVPAVLLPVLRGLLARRPEDRWANAAAVAQALRQVRLPAAGARDGTTLTHRGVPLSPPPLVASRVLLAISLAISLAVAGWRVWDIALAADSHRMADEAAAVHAHERGWLQLGIRPWAHVFVDGVAVGTTPLRRLVLRPGVHTVRIDNPYYRPLTRKVYIRPGETTALRVDLPLDAVWR